MAVCRAAEGGKLADPSLTSTEKYNWSEEYFLNLYKEYEWYFADPKYKNKSVWEKLTDRKYV